MSGTVLVSTAMIEEYKRRFMYLDLADAARYFFATRTGRMPENPLEISYHPLKDYYVIIEADGQDKIKKGAGGKNSEGQGGEAEMSDAELQEAMAELQAAKEEQEENRQQQLKQKLQELRQGEGNTEEGDKEKEQDPDQEQVHERVPDIVRLYNAGHRNILLVGPAGTGKTTAAQHVSKRLKMPFAADSCAEGMSEGVLAGWRLPNENGHWVYVPSGFVDSYQVRACHLLDEVDNAYANTLVLLNSGISNGFMNIPYRSPRVVERHDDALLLCAANTYGTGPDRVYVGRNQLDGAFLDRFSGAIVEFDYDKRLERKIAERLANKHNIKMEHVNAWLPWVWNIRALVVKHRIRRVFGTRALIGGLRNIPIMGMAGAQRSLFVGWSQEDMNTVNFKQSLPAGAVSKPVTP